MRRTTRVFLPLCLVLALASCGGTEPSTWIAEPSDGAAFIQWTRNDGSLTGTLAIAYEQTRESGDVTYAVESQSVSFTGVVEGSNITLTLEQGLGFSTNWNGTLEDDELTLTFPSEEGTLNTLRFRPGSREDYNAAIAALREEAADAQAAHEAEQAEAEEQAAVAEQEQAIDELAAKVEDGLAFAADAGTRADGPLRRAAKRFSAAEAALERAHDALERAQATGGDPCYDATDAFFSASDDFFSALDDVYGPLDDAEAAVGEGEAAVATLRQDWEELQSYVAGLPEYRPASLLPDEEIGATFRRARSAVREDRRAVNGYRRRAEQMVETANSYADEANEACY